MKQYFSVLLILACCGLASSKLLKLTRHQKRAERQLVTSLVEAKPTANRKLGLEDDLQREHEDQQNVNNMKLMIVNMKKEGELRTLESIISEIGDRVEEINDTIRSKTNEFIDKVDSVRKARSKVNNVVELEKKTSI